MAGSMPPSAPTPEAPADDGRLAGVTAGAGSTQKKKGAGGRPAVAGCHLMRSAPDCSTSSAWWSASAAAAG
eukprot:scaffold26777_cov101-Isochrysis_galbana.AAC.2